MSTFRCLATTSIRFRVSGFPQVRRQEVGASVPDVVLALSLLLAQLLPLDPVVGVVDVVEGRDAGKPVRNTAGVEDADGELAALLVAEVGDGGDEAEEADEAHGVDALLDLGEGRTPEAGRDGDGVEERARHVAVLAGHTGELLRNARTHHLTLEVHFVV